MTAEEKTLSLFETRVRELIMAYESRKGVQASLEEKILELEIKVEELEAQLAQSQHDYQTLKTAKMLTVSDGDLDSAKKRIAALIRTVDKCITLVKGDK